MGIFSSSLRLMDGWLRLTKKLKTHLLKTFVLTGPSHLNTPLMHSIILIEKLEVNDVGDLEVTAVLENEWRNNKGTYIFSSPDVAPIRAIATVPYQALPPGETFRGKDRRQLTNMLDRYQLFYQQEWKAAPPEVPTQQNDDPYPGGRLFF